MFTEAIKLSDARFSHLCPVTANELNCGALGPASRTRYVSAVLSSALVWPIAARVNTKESRLPAWVQAVHPFLVSSVRRSIIESIACRLRSSHPGGITVAFRVRISSNWFVPQSVHNTLKTVAPTGPGIAAVWLILSSRRNVSRKESGGRLPEVGEYAARDYQTSGIVGSAKSGPIAFPVTWTRNLTWLPTEAATGLIKHAANFAARCQARPR